MFTAHRAPLTIYFELRNHEFPKQLDFVPKKEATKAQEMRALCAN